MSFRPLSNHQTVVKPRVSRLNFYEGTIPVSEFVNCTERGKLGVENIQSRTSAGSTCLSVAKVPPDYVTMLCIFPQYSVAIWWLLIRRNLFFLRGKQASVRGRADTQLKKRYNKKTKKTVHTQNKKNLLTCTTRPFIPPPRLKHRL